MAIRRVPLSFDESFPFVDSQSQSSSGFARRLFLFKPFYVSSADQIELSFRIIRRSPKMVDTLPAMAFYSGDTASFHFLGSVSYPS